MSDATEAEGYAAIYGEPQWRERLDDALADLLSAGRHGRYDGLTSEQHRERVLNLVSDLVSERDRVLDEVEAAIVKAMRDAQNEYRDRHFFGTNIGSLIAIHVGQAIKNLRRK